MLLDPSLKAEMGSKPSDLDDPALIVGLTLWTAHQHERYLATHAARGDVSVPHRFPVILVDTLRRHADAGDPTCRLVLEWLTAKGFVQPGFATSVDEGAV